MLSLPKVFELPQIFKNEINIIIVKKKTCKLMDIVTSFENPHNLLTEIFSLKDLVLYEWFFPQFKYLRILLMFRLKLASNLSQI